MNLNKSKNFIVNLLSKGKSLIKGVKRRNIDYIRIYCGHFCLNLKF